MPHLADYFILSKNSQIKFINLLPQRFLSQISRLYRSSFFDSRLEALQRHEQLLIEGLFDPVIGAIEVIDGRTPPVFLIGGEWKLVGLFGLSLFLDIEVPVPFSLLVVVILVLLQFIELMHCLQPVVIFTVDGHVIGDGLGLGKLL